MSNTTALSLQGLRLYQWQSWFPLGTSQLKIIPSKPNSVNAVVPVVKLLAGNELVKYYTSLKEVGTESQLCRIKSIFKDE